MQTTSEQLTEMHQTVQQMLRKLELTDARHERAIRRYRLLWLGIMALVVAVLTMSIGSGPTALAQTEPQQGMSAAQLQSSVAKRKALIAQLPEEKQQKMEEFQQQVDWINQYMQTWDEEQAGAVVALMLSRIGDNMNAVPKMHQEMKTMNSLMKSMPIVAIEMQRMNTNMSLITAHMGVMTHNMDSTMGRMGRWMPW
jgi:hypothetical protein